MVKHEKPTHMWQKMGNSASELTHKVSYLIWLVRSSLFDLDNESPEEKLEQRFLILRHLRASVPLPLANKGVGAMLITPEK